MSATLTRDEVHAWCVSLEAPPATAAALFTSLSPGEQNRSARLRFERDRHRFIVAHGALRHLLGHYVGTPPDQIRFVYNAFGKPELSPEFGSRLRFNLSHSADLGLIALAADVDVGVDVEYVRPDFEYAAIAREFFPAADIDSPQAFFNCWTQKEACAKARGGGLAVPPDSDELWSLYNLQPAPGYVGALAIARQGWRLRQWHWRC